ncbi:MAG: hypothetical protein GXP62_10655, partial [Oligoflexia bacterium]|nr:hypothetical protein [Oligoflexia bacterium]
GQHSILVVGAKGARAFSQVTVSAGDVASVKPKLSRGFVAAVAADDAARARQIAQIYRALGSYADTDLILVAGESAEGELDVQLYQARTGNFSTILTEPRGDDPVATLQSSVGGLVDLLDDSGGLRTDAVYPRAAPLDIGTNAVLLGMLLDPEPIAGVSALGPGVGQDQGGGVPWVVWAGIGAVAAGGTVVGAVLLGGNKQTEAGGGTIIVGPMP